VVSERNFFVSLVLIGALMFSVIGFYYFAHQVIATKIHDESMNYFDGVDQASQSRGGFIFNKNDDIILRYMRNRQ
jgi:hypothetical protein